MSPLKERILVVACNMAATLGYHNIRRDAIAEGAGVGLGTVNLQFGDMAGLRQAIMQRAIDAERLDLLMMGLAVSDPVALSAPRELRIKALKTLL